MSDNDHGSHRDASGEKRPTVEPADQSNDAEDLESALNTREINGTRSVVADQYDIRARNRLESTANCRRSEGRLW